MADEMLRVEDTGKDSIGLERKNIKRSTYVFLECSLLDER